MIGGFHEDSLISEFILPEVQNSPNLTFRTCCRDFFFFFAELLLRVEEHEAGWDFFFFFCDSGLI